ncbi:MAG: exonuclease SbcCD subunit D C-terminal domain-containing protein [Reichenbachiella sp.]
MKILHTSDWHLGRTLYNRKRYSEFTEFLNWLTEQIREHSIDALLVAGDIFDTIAPSNRAQELYYSFLVTVANSTCRHIVITAGNHDSPSFLNAPKGLLKALNVYVVGSLTGNPADEVLVLRDNKNAPEAIICAVPYLRDRDIRTVSAGETIEEKGEKLIAGVKNHYAEVCAIAETQRADYQAEFGYVPIIAMGHLFTAGGKTQDDDGVRELYVGTLAHVGSDIFPGFVDYTALGHLHVPQIVGGSEIIRYSGSPIPMGFGEAKQRKQVVVVSFENESADIELCSVPSFQQLEKVAGDLKEIKSRIIDLKKQEMNIWLEVEYTGAEVVGSLSEVIEELIVGSSIEVLITRNRRIVDRVLRSQSEEESLDDLNVTDVFTRCLDEHTVPEAERTELMGSYNEIITSLNEDDSFAE